MNKNKIGLVIYILLLFQIINKKSSAQIDSSFKPTTIYKGNILDFTVDNLDNVYLLNSNNQLKKINANNDSVAIYNDIKKFGTIQFADVVNPLRILLFYADYNTVVTLNQLLNLRNIISLTTSGIIQTSAIAQAFDNDIWVFDMQENKLKKINEAGLLQWQTPDLRLITGKAIHINKIFEAGKYVCLYDSLLGIFSFDFLGGFNKNYPFVNWKNIFSINKYIYGTKNNQLLRLNVLTDELLAWPLPEACRENTRVAFSTQYLYFLSNEMICKYKIVQ